MRKAILLFCGKFSPSNKVRTQGTNTSKACLRIDTKETVLNEDGAAFLQTRLWKLSHEVKDIQTEHVLRNGQPFPDTLGWGSNLSLALTFIDHYCALESAVGFPIGRRSRHLRLSM